MRMHRFTAGIVAVTLALGMAVAQAHDEKGMPDKDEKPDAKLTLSGTSAAIGIGTTWGSGTLSYKGKSHKVRLRGLDIEPKHECDLRPAVAAGLHQRPRHLAFVRSARRDAACRSSTGGSPASRHRG